MSETGVQHKQTHLDSYKGDDEQAVRRQPVTIGIDESRKEGSSRCCHVAIKYRIGEPLTQSGIFNVPLNVCQIFFKRCRAWPNPIRVTRRAPDVINAGHPRFVVVIEAS